jgi:hypothetical protein
MSEDSRPEAGRTTQRTKTIRFGVPNSIDPKIWERLDPQNNRLTRLRVEKAREKYRKEVGAETRRIHFDNRGNLNSTAIPNALLQMKLKKADEFAEGQYSIFHDVWLRLGGVESAAFIRTISWMVTQRQFGPRGNTFAAEQVRRFRATGGLSFGLPEETIRKAFGQLKTDWRDKLEIKALEWESSEMLTVANARSAGTPRKGPESCYREWITENSVSLSIPSELTHREIVEQVARGANKPIPIAYLSDVLDHTTMPRGCVVFGCPDGFLDDIASTYDLGWWITENGLWMDQYPPRDIAYADANGSSPLTKSKGRPPERPDDFVAHAGELWKNAVEQATGAKVSGEQLRQIASELDDLKFVPPAKYLERSIAAEVRKFNSNHSHSKHGPIKAWSTLVEYADKDHLRGMRKLLSRCSKKLPASAVRKMIPDKKHRPTS